MGIGVVLLAAGASSRMGKPKQLLPIEGEPLLIKSVRAAMHSKATEIVIVLGSNYENHKELISGFPVAIIENAEWQKGMGSSLKRGLSYLLSEKKYLEAVIVLVCDQPFLSFAVINNLIDQFTQTKSTLVASAYAGILGVPALFHSSLFEEILAIADEQGAKKLIQQHLSKVKSVDFPDGIIDLDFPEDYELFLRNNSL